MMKTKKELLWVISVSLSKPEAISFARTLGENEKWCLVKISENPKARHIAKRERFVVARYPRKGEAVEDSRTMVVPSEAIQPI